MSIHRNFHRFKVVRGGATADPINETLSPYYYIYLKLKSVNMTGVLALSACPACCI